MSPNLVQSPIKAAIYGKLAGDTTLTNLLAAAVAGYSKAIYFEEAPQGAAFPYVIFSKLSGTPTYSFQSNGSIFDENTWLVKAVDRSTNSDNAEAIQQRVDVLLNDASLTVAGGTSVNYIRRGQDVTYSEMMDGVRYVHRGAQYRLIFS